MILAFGVILAVIVVWSWCAVSVTRRRVTMPLALMLAGLLIGWESSTSILDQLTSPVIERAVEVLLAVLLFLDAVEVGEQERGTRRIVARLVLVAVPLSLLAGTVGAAFTFPSMQLGVCLVLACIVTPTDMAPASQIVKDRRLPRRVRQILNVESGYNDGIVAPIFLFALAVFAAGDDGPEEAIADLLPAAGWALLVGLVIGGGAAWMAKVAAHRGWTDRHALGLGTLALPLLTYVVANGVGGNGFVAAFVAGLAHRAVTGPEVHETLRLAEDAATFASAALWFVFGQVLGLVLVEGIDWQALLYSALAVTVLRVLPVVLSLLGSSVSWRDRWLISWLGPRGIASVVFALLALHGLEDRYHSTILQVLVLTVALSTLLHGVSATLIAARLARAESVGAAPGAD